MDVIRSFIHSFVHSFVGWCVRRSLPAMAWSASLRLAALCSCWRWRIWFCSRLVFSSLCALSVRYASRRFAYSDLSFLMCSDASFSLACAVTMPRQRQVKQSQRQVKPRKAKKSKAKQARACGRGQEQEQERKVRSPNSAETAVQRRARPKGSRAGPNTSHEAKERRGEFIRHRARRAHSGDSRGRAGGQRRSTRRRHTRRTGIRMCIGM